MYTKTVKSEETKFISGGDEYGVRALAEEQSRYNFFNIKNSKI